MLFKDITIIDENFETREHMYIGVKADRIDYVATDAPTEDYGQIYEGKGKVLMPCFYDMHSHLPMVYMRGYGENLQLQQWLEGKIFPFEAKLLEEDIYYGCLLGIAEMLRYGIGVTQDMYINPVAVGRAMEESGIKGAFSISIVCPGEGSLYELAGQRLSLEALERFKTGVDDRVRYEAALHAEYTSTERIAKELAEFAAKNNLGMHVHVSETADEVEGCRMRHGGKSPVKYLHDCGIFDLPTVAAHCVHLDDEDIEILKADKVTVASNPKSNAKLGSGICPVKKLMDAGINVTIGTDSVASNNNLNMLEEMRFFSYFQKALCCDSTVISSKQLLYAATRAGAIGQRRMDSGLIKQGFKADLTVMDIDRIYMRPCYDIVDNIVFSASGNDVVLTMVDGNVLYKDGEYPTLDIDRIEYEVDKARRRILGELTMN